jgi:hypothetical protein
MIRRAEFDFNRLSAAMKFLEKIGKRRSDFFACAKETAPA